MSGIRFENGQDVLAVDPTWPRYYSARVKRRIDATVADGGPWYEIVFHPDGDLVPQAAADRTYFVSGQYIIGSGRLKTHTEAGWAEVTGLAHENEYEVEEVLGHRPHRHGRLPCAEGKNARKCKITVDYHVGWSGYSYTTWESEEQFRVVSYIPWYSLHLVCSWITGRPCWSSIRPMRLSRSTWHI